MELRHLRYFIAVAEELHFGRAAERIGIEQSPLSRAIRELEEDLGVKLLSRTSRSTRITTAGEAFLSEARRILDEVRAARSLARSVTRALTTRLRIGVSPSIAQPRLARLLSMSRAEEPSTELQVVDRLAREQAQQIRNGTLDIGLSPIPMNTDGLRSEALWRSPLVAVVPAGHTLTKAPCISFGAFLKQPDIVCYGELQAAWETPGNVDARREPPARSVSVSSLPMLLEIVAGGLGLGIALAQQVDSTRRLDLALLPFDSAPTVVTHAIQGIDRPQADLCNRFVMRARWLG